MSKDKTIYVCDYCGQESIRWVGKCPACGRWNTMKEIHVHDEKPSAQSALTKIAMQTASAQEQRESDQPESATYAPTKSRDSTCTTQNSIECSAEVLCQAVSYCSEESQA